ncbi:HI0074 family nucleotidyltransferase substrate-binding subunit [Desulfobacter postgatei]|jgi:nucleotidyltransferase substrate binding protein (TIGR01987 family)|uniref:HI0074 family nucleotidyltransferase substrate-binding subunit n=1 Tax=Desulfobacter postgatei TaxID=2293 RepID=UPI002A35D551|nr:HI0074 family nucleotidyltransferase substrate-binding subunit [Desulfobacter postgatei]MDX9964555.1 HI0074 family nucleotidyltransferase substrate-binding subunit [Desulfobacter postgatei]
MSNADEIRWKQRLENFGRALNQLGMACNRENLSELERAGLIQMFEFSFALAWKTLKDTLFYEGYNVKSPRETIRTSFEQKYISEDDTEIFLEAMEKGNLLSHTYQEENAVEAEHLIRTCYFPLLRRIYQTLEQKKLQ